MEALCDVVRGCSRFTKIVTILVVPNVAVLTLSVVPQARADHSFQGGTCYVTPEMCQNGYAGGLFYFRVSQYWGSPSQIQSRAQPGLTAAMSAWSSVAGPQVFRPSTDTNTPYNNVFVEEYPAYQSSDQNLNNQIAVNASVTLNHGWWGSNYQYYGFCLTNACLVDYSEVYVNDGWDSSCSGGITAGSFQYVYAHELGHVLGLDDHGSGALLMNHSWPTSYCYSQAWGTYGINGATATDIGHANCTSPKGVRCIYQY